MEYAKNGNLFSYVRKNPGIPEEKLREFFVQTARGIEFMHSRGFAHRDIKPENILLDENLNVKICDFGWSTLLANGALRKTFCGTYEYMAPEIFESSAYDSSVDVWSLGILLFELLHGFSPFRGKGVFEIYRNIVSGKIPFKEGLDPLAKQLISSILQRAPFKRPPVSTVLAHPYLNPRPPRPDLALNLASISSQRNRVKRDLPEEDSSTVFKPQKKVADFRRVRAAENRVFSQRPSSRGRSNSRLLKTPSTVEQGKESISTILRALRADFARPRVLESPLTDRRPNNSREISRSILQTPLTQRSLSNAPRLLSFASESRSKTKRGPIEALKFLPRPPKFSLKFATETSTLANSSRAAEYSSFNQNDTVKKRPKINNERTKSAQKVIVARQLFPSYKETPVVFDGPYFSRY